MERWKDKRYNSFIYPMQWMLVELSEEIGPRCNIYTEKIGYYKMTNDPDEIAYKFAFHPVH